METLNLQKISIPDSGWIGDYGLGSTGAGRRREIPCIRAVAPGSENWNYAERVAGTPDRPQAQNIVRPVLLYSRREGPMPWDGHDRRARWRLPTLIDVIEGVDVAKRLTRWASTRSC